MTGDTRERMIEAAVHALQRDGVEGMSFTEVLRESGAARGAIYHHFPGGKSHLEAEAATENGNEVRALLARLPAESPAAVVRGFTSPTIGASCSSSGASSRPDWLRAKPVNSHPPWSRYLRAPTSWRARPGESTVSRRAPGP